MDTVSARAALCARLRTTSPTPLGPPAGLDSCKPAWRRAPRTGAALKAQLAAIEAAVSVLKAANIPYSQPLPGKLVVAPPEGVAGLTVTFWPGRERLRIQGRPTKRDQNLRAFKQALVAQGHRISGYPLSKLESNATLPCQHTRARQRRLFLQRVADLAAMETAYEELTELHRQRLQDLSAGRRIRPRDPRSIDARRRFQRALNRAMRDSVED